MEVSPHKPFKIVYSLYQHQFLGYLFESFAVQLDDTSKLTFQHQNISSANAGDFAAKLTEVDYELIRLMDETRQETVVKKFSRKKQLPNAFFYSVWNPEKGDKNLQKVILQYIEERRSKILTKAKGKLLFEMGNDGEPTYKTIRYQEEKATILFHVMRNPDHTQYFPTIKFQGEKLQFQYKNAIILSLQPAFMLLQGNLYEFEDHVDGKKIQPFLNKKFIQIPKNIEDNYYRKFVAPLIESFKVVPKGFEIKKVTPRPHPVLSMTELPAKSAAPTLFDQTSMANESGNLLFQLKFIYGDFELSGNLGKSASVKVQKEGDEYTFFKVCRNTHFEKELAESLRETGIKLHQGRFSLDKPKAFAWLEENRELIAEKKITVKQEDDQQKKYFLGHSSISLEIKEDRDWFDIKAIVKFGEYEIPFLQLRKQILAGKHEIKLPNGEVAVIPESWFARYADLFHFMHLGEEKSRLKKHHFALVEELRTGNLANVEVSEKLKKLHDFSQIEDFGLPTTFKGELRPYQKAGYNWMRFLEKFKLGGCLADDMGLGKTVQTLALLQQQKTEHESKSVSLLIMPTSLLYNWEMEAKKFTTALKVLNYTGTNRHKSTVHFDYYDLVITSYGIARIDIDILKTYYFNYIILDESQVIKNPQSNIAQAVQKLKASHRLILTGTPIENSTMDLWSQMNFINPGLLGTQTFFKKEFLLPIEKAHDDAKKQRLYSLIKPFILRRHKSQVATELPGKVEKIQYCSMTEEQEKRYEEVKSSYRNKILEEIEYKGLGRSQFVLLQGLTQLRQIANHPKMADPDYAHGSGKMEDVLYALKNVVTDGHKVLIFSQFVKHLNLVKAQLKALNVRFAYLDGATKDRKAEVDKFQAQPEIKAFLISLKAGGIGLNLTAADYVFILDPWWNPAVEQQAIDRAHRIGQENKVFIYKFITQNSVEEKILALQEAKLQLANELITTEESFVKKLTTADIKALLE